MNRDAMIEALAKAIQLHPLPAHGGVHMGGGQARSVAAALLDLCGPEPLVWVGSTHAKHRECIEYAETTNGTYFIVDDTDDFTGYYCDFVCIRDCTWFGTGTAKSIEIISHFHDDDLTKIKAAAQDHATAAHWANTPLGKLVQP